VPNRRNFLGALFTAPVATAILPTVERVVGGKAELPTSCDLSCRSVEWALSIGEKNNYGKPICLIIGPENLFPAREIFGKGIELTYTPDAKIVDEERFGYRVVSALPKNFWMVQFERGTVSSQGPS
jgi:hypothetical protein